jgi:hypothetical protein
MRHMFAWALIGFALEFFLIDVRVTSFSGLTRDRYGLNLSINWL